MTMRLLFSISLFVLLFSGCSSSKVNIDRLQVKQSRYYLPNSSKPYSGKVVFRYENGDVSNVVEIKNGVPDGKWIAYGYKKEIVQEGSYTPIDLRNEVDFFTDSINRLNVCVTKEGMAEFTDILLITDRPNKKDADDEKKRILAVLKSHSILIKGDTINEIKYVKNELSNQ